MRAPATNRASSDGDRNQAPARPRVVRAEKALRELVAELGSAAWSGAEESVVLELEVDEALYTLTRRPLPAEVEVASLSSREREIARMIAKGYTNRTVALVLDISPWTVDTHLRRVFAKLGVRSRSAMVAQLIDAGVLKDLGEYRPDWDQVWRGRGVRARR